MMPDSPLGTLIRTGDTTDLTFERRLPTTVQDAWSAITDPDRCARWFGRWTGDPTTGQVSIVLTAEADQTPQAVAIDQCDPPYSLKVRLMSPSDTWRVSLTLTADGEATLLHFVHHLSPDIDPSSVGPGWHYYLDRLTATIGHDEPALDFDDYYPALASAYERQE